MRMLVDQQRELTHPPIMPREPVLVLATQQGFLSLCSDVRKGIYKGLKLFFCPPGRLYYPSANSF